MDKVAKYLAVDKAINVLNLIKYNGGLRNSFKKYFRYDDLKMGKLVGVDDFGNHYYENSTYFFGRNRWVEYADHVGWRYDASMVPPQWYGWLHYKTDLIPSQDPSRVDYEWTLMPSENLTGTDQAYMAYSTVPQKIKLWKPKSKAKA